MYGRLKETAVEVVKRQYNLAYAELYSMLRLRTFNAIREDNFLFRKWDDVGTVRCVNGLRMKSDIVLVESSEQSHFDIQRLSRPSSQHFSGQPSESTSVSTISSKDTFFRSYQAA